MAAPRKITVMLWVLLLSLLLLRVPPLTLAYEDCSAESGGGICPNGNTCCLMADGSSGCIPSDLGKYNATCCKDGLTGCGVGYSCREAQGDCLESNSTSFVDPLVKVLPRYRLCKSSNIQEMIGLKIDKNSSLAYYSSHGPVESINNESDVGMVVIAMHGAGRNADDYFCAMTAAVDIQTVHDNVVVIAPRFLAESDIRSSPSFLYWEDVSDGAWRYGADSLGPTKVSSLEALDKLVEGIRTNIPSLKRLVVAGHSSGGQIVQRWAFLTSTWFSEQMKAVVANPSSYVYLSPLRFIKGEWILPSTKECHQYDQWEWGLDSGGDIDVPYKQQHLTNVSLAIERFGTRRIDFLAGSLDICNVSSPGWCHSHGLETTCMDELQGSNRLERNAHYIASLRKLGIWEQHTRKIVQGVGHDHALMFQSAEGLESIFGTMTNVNEETY